ncbi:hypothetical protein AAZX31_07G093600 [Glycine max]
MKQKIVIKLQMDCDKCRNKALKIAAEVPGVTSVSLEGDDNDRVAVTGVNVDMVCLANQLKKKFSSVTIPTVEDLIKADEEKKKKEEEKKKKEESCHGKCDTSCCTKCESIHCDGECVMLCANCESPKCDGDLSECEYKPCPKPPSPCPKWCNCPKCYVPYQQPCYYPYPPPVVCYDTFPDSPCSIM